MELHSASGPEDVTWGSGRSIAAPESLQFAERNVHIVGLNGARGSSRVECGRLRAYSVDGFTLVYAFASDRNLAESTEVRTRENIAADGRDRYGLMMQLRGGRRLSQLGRDQELSSGSLAFFSTSEPYVFQHQRGAAEIEVFTLFMPSRFVDQHVRDGKALCLRDGSTHVGNLARNTLRLFATDAWKFSPEQFYRSAKAIGNLSMLALAEPDGTERRSVRAGHLERVKHVIRSRMLDPELTLDQIAAEVGLSVNYLHKLFRDERLSVWQYLKMERLTRARELLRAAGPGDGTITEIAFSCGFSDSSYFSRAFRAAFGVSPREALAWRGST